ncbi:tryptophan synthase subunit alpha [Shigella flexneri]
MPVEESAPFRQAALRHNVAPIFICPPNADDDLLRQIASYGRGYTYLLSRAGVTGAEKTAARITPQSSGCEAERVQRCTSIAGVWYFHPDQVKAAIDAGAAGAISRSAIVKIIEQHINEPEKMLAALKVFVQPMKAARAVNPPTAASSAGGVNVFFNEAGKILNSFNIYLFTVSLTRSNVNLRHFSPNSNIIKQINPAT